MGQLADTHHLFGHVIRHQTLRWRHAIAQIVHGTRSTRACGDPKREGD